MLTFSQDPHVAERQMQAVIFYLTTFGYIDGDFDISERAFVRGYIEKLVAHRVKTGLADADPALAAELVGKFTTHFHEVFEQIDRHVRELFTEAVSREEEQDAFIHAKLKLRCFEIFQGFDRATQDGLLDTLDELSEADGQVHPAEVKFRGELAALLEAHLGVELVEDADVPRVRVTEERLVVPPRETNHFFDAFEVHYARDPETFRKQVEADRGLIERTIEILDRQRATGQGKLAGKTTVAELAAEAPFLDGHTAVHPAVAGRRYELTVLGDLHGCYSCLKGALLQSKFFEKLSLYQRSPETTTKPLVVLLGDYIDRGLFSLNGVLRTVMQLFVSAPENVVILRGNHEYFLERRGRIFAGVRPAEAVDTMKDRLPIEVFRDYMRLFDAMPGSLLFDRAMFVHGGIPRDRLLKERYHDLSSLNDPDLRFQMMWSDPSSADVIPAELQEQTARFPFGRLQATAFLQRIGCHTMVRGHEKVDEGFRRTYHDDDVLLITLFSAGGETNDDLPEGSSYRSVTPKALTMTWADGEFEATPWRIDYETYNDPKRNAFFRPAAD